MRLAVLIDADNISGTDVKEVFDIAERLGEAITRRAFGNVTIFSGKGGWKEPVRNFAIEARPQVGNVDRKNAADFALVIDAMDCLYSGRYDGLVLVSSAVTSPVWRNASGTMARRCMGLEMDAHP